jgi:hypothetical protein
MVINNRAIVFGAALGMFAVYIRENETGEPTSKQLATGALVGALAVVILATFEALN